MEKERLIDNIVSHYRIVKKIGRGGMAEVYEAIDTGTKKHVALKVLLPHLASDDVMRHRFLREAKVGMQLDHPGITRVFEVGKDKRPFMAMELVKGQTLNEIIEHKPLPLKQSISIAQQIAEALCVAHKQGIIHRDIKPGNIMITGDRVKLMDFGLARVLDTTSLTEKYEVLGTLYYMSPEQLIGEPVDARSDIFSLGAVLYQMLTARRPFTGEHAGTIIHAILYSEPQRIRDLDRSLPNEVEQVVFKALQKKNHRRYQSTIDMKTDLLSLENSLKGHAINLIASDISPDEVFEGDTRRGINPALVGRDRELEILQKHLTWTLQGRSSAVLLRGEAGIGKSRLAWELGRQARKQDALYLMGRCAASNSIPYQPIVESIRQYFDLKGIIDRKTFEKHSAGHVKHTNFRWDAVASLIMQQAVMDAAIISKEQIWETMTQTIRVIAKDRPIVMHLDDLHWADAPILELLEYIIRSTKEDRVLLIGTYRPEDISSADHPLRVLLRKTKKDQLLNIITLNRLDKRGTRDIVNSVFERSNLTGGFTDLLYEETEGNPLFVLEVLKLLREENIISKNNGGWRLTDETVKLQIPKSITEVIFRRLEKLNREERQLLDIAAIEGLSFNSDTLVHCLGQPKIQILRRLQELESSHNLIHATRFGYQFDHGKIRDIAYNNITPELKREYHRILGNYLCKKHVNQKEFAGKIAHHLLKAGEQQKALPYLVMAGNRAQDIWTSSAALEYYKKGLEIIDKIDKRIPSENLLRAKLEILKNRVGLQFLLGNNTAAMADANIARNLSLRLGTVQDRIFTLQWWGDIMRRMGHFKAAIKCHMKILSLCRKNNNKRCIAYNLVSIATNYWIIGDHRQALQYVNGCLKVSRDIRDKYIEGRGLHCLGMVYRAKAQYKTALVYLKRSLRLFLSKRIKSWIAYTTVNMGWCYIGMQEYRRAESFMRKGLSLLRKLDEKHMHDYTLMALGMIQQSRGEYKSAIAQFERILEKGKERGERRMDADLLINIGGIHVLQGNFATACGLLKKAVKICRSLNLRLYENNINLSLANIHIFRGDYKKGHALLEKILPVSRKNEWLINQWSVERLLCRVWIDCGGIKRAVKALINAVQLAPLLQTKEARIASCYDTAQLKFFMRSRKSAADRVEKSLRSAYRWDLADSIAEGLSLTATLTIEGGDFEKAKKYADRLLRFAVEKGRKPDQAYARLYLARIMFSAGNMLKTKVEAGTSLNIAQELGMKPLIWQARHVMGKVYMRQKQYTQAQHEFMKAGHIVNKIALRLPPNMKGLFLRKKEIVDLFSNMHIVIKAEDNGR